MATVETGTCAVVTRRWVETEVWDPPVKRRYPSVLVEDGWKRKMKPATRGVQYRHVVSPWQMRTQATEKTHAESDTRATRSRARDPLGSVRGTTHPRTSSSSKYHTLVESNPSGVGCWGGDTVIFL